MQLAVPLSPSSLVLGCRCYRRDMSSPVQHRWDLSPAEAQALQQELRRRVVVEDDFGPIRFVAGVDNSYVPATATTCAGVVVLSWPELAVVERQVARTPTTFPYVPGLLSFREAPGVLAAIALLRTEPDLFIFDGQGIAHMRGLGLASHVHRPSRTGQAHHHRGALADSALHGDLPTVLLHDHLGSGQANACARDAPRCGGPVERREDVRQLLVRDAHTPIAHGDDGPLVVPAHGDVHRCTLRAVLDSVTDDVLHHALQLQTVALDHHAVARVHHHRCDPLWSAGLHAGDHVAYRGGHIDGLHAQVQ